MGVEDFQAFEEVTQSPGDGREFAGDGRGEGDLAEFAAAVGKQLFDLRRADAARLRVDGVEPEVVGEDEVIRLVHWRIGRPGRFYQPSGSRISGGRPGSRVRKPGGE